VSGFRRGDRAARAFATPDGANMRIMTRLSTQDTWLNSTTCMRQEIHIILSAGCDRLTCDGGLHAAVSCSLVSMHFGLHWVAELSSGIPFYIRACPAPPTLHRLQAHGWTMYQSMASRSCTSMHRNSTLTALGCSTSVIYLPGRASCHLRGTRPLNHAPHAVCGPPRGSPSPGTAPRIPAPAAWPAGTGCPPPPSRGATAAAAARQACNAPHIPMTEC